jgi:hypothetical protein
MELKDLCREIYAQATAKNQDFVRDYFSKFKSISKAISNFNGIKTSLDCDLTEHQLNHLRLSLVLSDFTSVIAFPSGSKMTVAIEEGRSPFSPGFYLVTKEFIERHLVEDNKSIGAGFIYPDHDEAQRFLREVEPLAQSGRLMFQPHPVAVTFRPMPDEIKSIPKKEGSLLGVVHPVETDFSGEGWCIVDGKGIQSSIPLKIDAPKENHEEKLASVMIPFIEGMSFVQLAEIIEGEEDCLAEFRSSIKKLLAEVQAEPNQSNDIVNDIVRPATDKIERRFKAITKIRTVKTAGAILSTAALGLVAYTSTGFLASIASMLGAGGLGLIAKEQADYLQEKAELKELPFYLLWRLGRVKRHS